MWPLAGGNDTIDVDDILAMLDAFSGNYGCNCPGGGGGGWGLTGNAGTNESTNFVGTTDNIALNFRVNNQRVMRYEPNATSPNVVGGFSGNIVIAGIGATIGGGGSDGSSTCAVCVSGENIGNSCGTCSNAPAPCCDNDDCPGGACTTVPIACGSGQCAFQAVGNLVIGDFGTVGGGRENQAGGLASGVIAATVCGGANNTASARYSTVGGGDNNTAGNTGGPSVNSFAWATVGGGRNNQALGRYSTVPGGVQNEARAQGSFAAGSLAIVRDVDEGTFVWADEDPPGGAFFTSTGPNQFLINAAGGVGIGTNAPTNQLTVRGVGTDTGGVSGSNEVMARFQRDNSGHSAIAVDAISGQDSIVYLAENGDAWWDIRQDSSDGHKLNIRYQSGGGLNDTFLVMNNTGQVGLQNNSPAFPLHVGTTNMNGNGAHVTAGGNWTNGSSRDWKENFENIDKQEVLRKVAEMPLTQWQYKGEDRSMHIGPTAQDFREAFGLGHDERYITTIDADGVAFAAIQGLHQVVQEKDCEISQLREQKDREISELRERLAKIEAMLATTSNVTK